MPSNDMNAQVRRETEPARGFRRWVVGVAVVLREAAALARQTPLMPLDLRWSPLRLPPSTRDLVVVLHGLFATAGAMRPLRRAIERTALHPLTASFSYEPGCDVRTLVARLRLLLSDAPDSTRIHLVGHSLGGIVARYYAQVGLRDPRLIQTISLGSPFGGTRVSSLVPDCVSRDVAVGSWVLRQIERNWERGASIPHTSIVASHDQLVVPAWSAAYGHGDVVVANARGHNALLFDAEVARVVAEAVARQCRGAATLASVSPGRGGVMVPAASLVSPCLRPMVPSAAG